jgi:hypothetical protein
MLAFQEEEHSKGGCPDVTERNFTVYENASQLLQKKETFGVTIVVERLPLQESCSYKWSY